VGRILADDGRSRSPIIPKRTGGRSTWSPSKICLFTYENNTFITRSYQPGRTRYKIVVKKAAAKLFDLRTGAELRGYVDGNTTVFEVLQMPRTYTAYRFE